MFHRFKPARWAALGLVPALALGACGDGSGTAANGAECNGLPEQPTIDFAAYSTPREAYGKIISAFKSDWKEDHDDQEVIFQESYDGSTLQASRVVGGYEADIVALAGSGRRRDRRRRLITRLDAGGRRRHGDDIRRRLRRPARQPWGSRTGTTSRSRVWRC